MMFWYENSICVPITGPGPFYKALEQSIGRKAVVVGKPGLALADIVMRKYKIKDRKRVLFIGDMWVNGIYKVLWIDIQIICPSESKAWAGYWIRKRGWVQVASCTNWRNIVGKLTITSACRWIARLLLEQFRWLLDHSWWAGSSET